MCLGLNMESVSKTDNSEGIRTLHTILARGWGGDDHGERRFRP